MTLLPEGFKNTLVQLRGHGDLEFWGVADIALAMFEEYAGNPAQWIQCRDEIADLAGVTPDIVTEYKKAAAFYPPSFREGYPTLTRYHFRTAMRAGDLESADAWLIEAAFSADEYGGHPMPIRVMQAKMNGAGHEPRRNGWQELPVTLDAQGRRVVVLPPELDGDSVKVKGC